MQNLPSTEKASRQPTAVPITPANPVFDELSAFTRWALDTGSVIPLAPYAGVRKVGQFMGLTLLRSGKFQAQLWICEPYSEIPDHSHPNVDTIQVFVTGDLALRLNGKSAMEEELSVLPDGRCSHNGRWIRVRPTDTHGATIGAAGAAFINFQHWLNGEPSSAELDWEGPALGEEHRVLLAARLEEYHQASIIK